MKTLTLRHHVRTTCVAFLLTGLTLSTASAQGQQTRSDARGAAGRVQCIETSASQARSALAGTNAIRSAKGLAPLRLSPALSRAAAQQACDMARTNRMTHGGAGNGPKQRLRAAGYRIRIVAENIGAGFSRSEQVIQAWQSSPGHLSNMLIPQTREFGIGKAVGADGKTVFWAAIYTLPG